MTTKDPKEADATLGPSPNNGSTDSFPGDIFAVLSGRLPVALNALSYAFNSDAAPEQERSRYVIALIALAGFLRGFHGSDLYSDKLMELASALDDLDDGISPPLLTPAGKGKGRRREPSAKMRGRVGTGCVVLQFRTANCYAAAPQQLGDLMIGRVGRFGRRRWS